ncbi:MAG TPA: winged helix-turn-helix transcriptional regulator [Candidatus Paceibacterota bacterium]|nr:winged helix-turn-helix transcriptional regulator [Candidatus Paceibacterota bacterium]
MKNLNELVKQYKKTELQETFSQIFELLEETIVKKAKYVFYKQRFFSDESLKLCDTKKVELEDIKQELRLEIIEWINRCKRSLPFDKYLYSNLWNWKPKSINKDFLESLKIISIYRKTEEGEDENVIERIPTPEQKIEDLTNYDEMFENLTIIEKMIINILRENSKATQQQIAEIIGVTQQQIVKYLKKIRKKFIKRL